MMLTICRYKAHKTPITSLEWVAGTGLFMTGGADGFVKVCCLCVDVGKE